MLIVPASNVSVPLTVVMRTRSNAPPKPTLPVLMRAAPSCTLYNPVTGATNSFRNVDNGVDYSGNVSTVIESAATVETSSGVANATFMYQLTASIEL